MKSLVFISVVLCILIVGSVSWKSTAASKVQKQRAVTEFNQPVLLQGIVLKGRYLFVHDDSAMARGEACTFVYRGEAEVADKLVVSFHCTPVERAKATRFTFRTVETSSGIMELREFQFIGEREAHAVPTSKIMGVVPLVN